jgi:hypothetical protein
MGGGTVVQRGDDGATSAMGGWRGADGSERGKAGEERAEEDAGGTGDARCDGDRAVTARLKKDDGSCACPNGHVLGRPNHICRFLPYVAMEAPNSRLTHLRAR